MAKKPQGTKANFAKWHIRHLPNTFTPYMKKTYITQANKLFGTLAVAACMLCLLSLGPAPAPDQDLDRLVGYMVGSYSSAAQAQRDTSYFDIRLHMARIWPERKDGYWLYVEQARADVPARPYRQRVYHVHRISKAVLASDVYMLHKPLRYTGGYKDASLLSSLNRDSLTLKEGCAINLEVKSARHYGGQTGERSCPSDLKDASFATSAVTVGPDTLLSWDRGFNAEGKQVWGAERGGYYFVKQR